MVGPGDFNGKPSLHGNVKRGSCKLGCLLTGAVCFLLLLVFGLGIGQPYTYWLEISQVQAFDGEDSVVLFVEVRRTMRYAGFMQEAPIEKTIQLLRVDVSRDGQASQVSLKFDKGTTFNTNIAPIIKLPDHCYLIQEPSMGRPSCQLRRIVGDRIESLSFEESGRLLQTIGLRCGGSRSLDDFEEFDRISERNGWQRLNGTSYRPMSEPPIVSPRHNLRLLFAKEDQSQAIVADSLAGPTHWSKTLVKVNTGRWKSYQSPLR